MRAVGILALTWASTASAVTTQRPDTLPPVTVTVTRADIPLARLPFAVAVVDKGDLTARPTWGLDEALAGVPGVFAANRYNFSLDQRLAIRGFGARSAFAVRGIKILLDGIPQTLPDGQGQLTHVDLGSTDRIEVLRGSASALYGNASGGVISIWTDPRPPVRSTGEVRVVAGTFGPGDDGSNRTWTKWQGTGRFRVGSGGGATLSVSRLSYEGERDHSAADLRALSGRLRLPLGSTWSLTALGDVGDQPRADNPGALNLTELGRNRDTVPPLNLATHAGKDVLQGQAGATLRGRLASGDEATVTVFGVGRELENPQTFAYIRLHRAAYGTRAVFTRRGGGVTAGIDMQRQRDDRTNFGNAAGAPDTVRSLDQLEHVTELGPFVQGVVGVAARTTLTAGVRYDRVSFDVRDRLIGDSTADLKYRNDSGRRVMAALSGSLGATLQASDAVTLYASAGSSFETPTTTELANRPDTAGGFNRDLSPQRAWTFEAGARGARRGASWEVALYQADVRDALVSFEIPTSPGRRFFRNAGSTRYRGVELAAGAALLRGMDFRVTWTYSDFRYRRYAFTAGGTTHVLDGRRLPGIPQQALRLALRARPASFRGGWGEIETQYASRYAVDDTLSRQTSPWWVTNLRMGWESGHVAPFVAVQNLFNRKYVASVVVNAAAGRYYEPAPGRNLYVGCRYLYR